jgi:hypothetical protein
MESDSKDKKPYSRPALTELNLDIATLVADLKNCSDEEAAELLELLRHPQQKEKQSEQRAIIPLNQSGVSPASRYRQKGGPVERLPESQRMLRRWHRHGGWCGE